MNALHSYALASRRHLEPALGIVVLVLAAYWYLGIMGYQIPQFVGGETVFRLVVLPASLLIPVAFGLLVIGSSIVVAVAVFKTLVNERGDSSHTLLCLARLGLCAILVVVAANVVYYGVGSYYAIHFGNPGGVVLHPYVVLAPGGFLSIIVLARTAVIRPWDTAIFGTPAT